MFLMLFFILSNNKDFSVLVPETKTIYSRVSEGHGTHVRVYSTMVNCDNAHVYR